LPDAGLDAAEGITGRVKGLWMGLYWVPQVRADGLSRPVAHARQVVAAPCFTISGLMFMIEVQESWWRIKPLTLGWCVRR
jgi:hypothetical protein